MSKKTMTVVKVEAAPGSDGNEIQNYLESFNKEIQADPREGTTYYVDANGQFYYSPRVVCVNPGESSESAKMENGEEAPVVVPITQEGAIVHAAEPHQEEGQVSIAAGSDQMLLSSNGQFGTVTLVPSENNGELSYVLFMPTEQTKEEGTTAEGTDAEAVEGEEDQDLTVYDFDEEAGAIQQVTSGNESEVEEPVEKKVRMVSKKSLQAVTTAHMCNYCNYTSPKRYLLSRHMKSHSEERPFKCSVCERGFKTLASRQNHVNTHTGTKPHNCRYCDSTFTTSGELVRHIRYKHTHEKPHRCPDCDYASVELSKLKRHVRCHTGERPYQCPHCTYASPDTFKLKRHLRIHTGEKPYECDICHARFTQSNSLKAHRLIHSVADKPVFKCELCPATCGRKTDLRIHVQKLHTSDRMLKCRRCGQSFPDRYQYKVHVKTHEGEKCYKCGLCPYASISARHLESHMLIHTDQKPYECDTCHQSFRQKQLLRRHHNLYHTPDYTPPPPREKSHECPECGRSFRHKGNLIRHMAIHDPDSEAQEKSMALKIGRQKKVQYIDGQQVELVSGEEDEEGEEEDEMEDDEGVEIAQPTPGVIVNGTDGQPYVVLEVIQLADGSGTEFVMAADDGTEVRGEMPLTAAQQQALMSSAIDRDPLLPEEPPLLKPSRKFEKPEGMDNCFGFGDEEDEEELDEDIKQVNIISVDSH